MNPQLEPNATQTASEAEPHASDVTPLAAHLFLVLEADQPRAGGARHSLTSVDEVVIGRGAARTFRREQEPPIKRLSLALPARTLSGMHARLRNERGHWSIEDLGSTNGTFVNGTRIQQAILNDRDTIEVGRTWWIFRDALPTPRATLPDIQLSELREPFEIRTLLPEAAEELRLLSAIANTRLPVLLLGETGTGKELLARRIHAQSGRSGPLVPLNSGALTSTLLEAQLFGHVRGAFSGALRDEPGLIRAADKGTLFLDEIGDMPPAAQVALLRVLQEGDVLAVGATRPSPVDVRVIAATHRPLHALTVSGAFRADLLARLRGHLHTLPALRKRREDLGILLGDVLRNADPQQRVQRLAPDAVRSLLDHNFPLNVRELEHALTRAAALVDDGVLRSSQLLPGLVELQLDAPVSSLETPPELSPQDEKLRAELLSQLSRERGNVANVARAMGKARMQVHRWMKRFGIDPEVYRRGAT